MSEPTAFPLDESKLPFKIPKVYNKLLAKDSTNFSISIL